METIYDVVKRATPKPRPPAKRKPARKASKRASAAAGPRKKRRAKP